MQSGILKNESDGETSPSLTIKKSQLMQTRIIDHEASLIAKAQQGDQAAFKELVHMHLANVLALSFKFLGNKSQAEDVAQEVMLSLWQNVEKYDPTRAKFSTWVYRITANKCLDHLRKKTPDQLPEDYDAATEADQDKLLYNKQIATQMETSLKTLPERQYLALTLFHYQGLKMQEVAEIMECSSEAVESLLARARRSLKEKLKPTWQEYKGENSPIKQKQKEGEEV